jgi:predicted  nucleic acid-binding Zn-ribbon protein
MLVVALALVTAAPAAAAVSGTVVHRVKRSHSFVVATGSGQLAAIHARRSPQLGRVVQVATRRLRNGRLHSRSVRVVGRASRVRLRGTVTYANRRQGVFTVSAPGASILVNQPSTAGPVPPVGSIVTTNAQIDAQGNLVANNIDGHGWDKNGIEIEGTILAIDAQTRTLSVSADDCHESRGTVSVLVPAAFDLSQFQVGRDVDLVLTRQADGTFVLVRGMQGLAGNPDPIDRSPVPLPVTPAPPVVPPAGGSSTPGTGGAAPGTGTQTPAAPVAGATTVDTEGTILAIDGQTRTVKLSNRSVPSAAPTSFIVPLPFDLSSWWVGQELHVVLNREADGTLMFQRVIPPPPVEYLKVKATIVAVDGQARMLTLRSCDHDSCSGPLKVVVPPALDLSRFRVGQRAEFVVTKQTDGTYVLQRSSISRRDDNRDDDDDHEDN